jgi:hypothetical protein
MVEMCNFIKINNMSTIPVRFEVNMSHHDRAEEIYPFLIDGNDEGLLYRCYQQGINSFVLNIYFPGNLEDKMEITGPLSSLNTFDFNEQIIQAISNHRITN